MSTLAVNLQHYTNQTTKIDIISELIRPATVEMLTCHATAFIRVVTCIGINPILVLEIDQFSQKGEK